MSWVPDFKGGENYVRFRIMRFFFVVDSPHNYDDPVLSHDEETKGLDEQTDVPDSARDILDRRYAAGEINKDEYEEKKRTLSESTDSINKWL